VYTIEGEANCLRPRFTDTNGGEDGHTVENRKCGTAGGNEMQKELRFTKLEG